MVRSDPEEKGVVEEISPPKSTVKFEPHLTGPPMINAMLADKMQIGTMGDMPSLVLSTKQKIADVRLVSVTMFSNGQTCNKFLVGKSAPQFNDYNDAMKWMSGKPFAYHRGTCANRATESIIAKGVFKPSEILVMPIEVIASNFEAGKLSGGDHVGTACAAPGRAWQRPLCSDRSALARDGREFHVHASGLY